MRQYAPWEPEELRAKFETVAEFKKYMESRPPKQHPPVVDAPYPLEHLTPTKAGELGDNWLRGYINPDGEFGDEYGYIVNGGRRWADGGNHPALDEIYNQTQAKLRDSGMKQVNAFRGIRISPHTQLAKDIFAGKVSAGDEIEVDGCHFASWTTKHTTARFFASLGDEYGNPQIGIVLEQVVQPENIVTGKNIHEGFEPIEDELIVKRNSGDSKKLRIREVLIP